MKEQRSNYLIYGHRGASGLLPENTIEAFELALEQGADAIETDVRRTLDGRRPLGIPEPAMTRGTSMSSGKSVWPCPRP